MLGSPYFRKTTVQQLIEQLQQATTPTKIKMLPAYIVPMKYAKERCLLSPPQEYLRTCWNWFRYCGCRTAPPPACRPSAAALANRSLAAECPLASECCGAPAPAGRRRRCRRGLPGRSSRFDSRRRCGRLHESRERLESLANRVHRGSYRRGRRFRRRTSSRGPRDRSSRWTSWTSLRRVDRSRPCRLQKERKLSKVANKKKNPRPASCTRKAGVRFESSFDFGVHICAVFPKWTMCQIESFE